MANMMMQRAGMQPVAQMAAAPGGPPQAQQGPSPEDIMLDEFTKRAAAAGIDLNAEMQKGGDPTEALTRAMQQIWKAQPTDDNAEMIDMLSQKFGIPPPWVGQQGDQKMKLGGPEDKEKIAMLNSSAPEREMEDYNNEMMHRAAKGQNEMDRMYDRVQTGMENDDPGMERAMGPMRSHLHNYYGMRGAARRNQEFDAKEQLTKDEQGLIDKLIGLGYIKPMRDLKW